MSEAFAKVNGLPLASWSLHVPYSGPWFARVVQEDDSGTIAPGDAVELLIGTVTLKGTASLQTAGTQALQRRMTIVGGKNGWGALIESRGYHADNGVKAFNVANDAAALVGETLGDFTPERTPIGIDFVRMPGPASRALEQAIGNAPWFVDYTGITQVKARDVVVADPSTYEIEEYDPRTHVARIYVDDLNIGVGNTISARLDTQETIQSFDLTQDGDKLRMIAYCGILPTATTQIENVFRKIVERIVDSRLRGSYRYRVINMNGDGRVNLQAVSARIKAPKLICVEMWPGVAGFHAELGEGATALVEFADDGDPTQPVITHFRGKADGGFVPVSVAFANGERAAAAQGDLVTSGGPGTVVTLIPAFPLGGQVLPGPLAPALGIGLPYFVSFSTIPPDPAGLVFADPLYGAVSTGSPKLLLP